jgi:amino acid permease
LSSSGMRTFGIVLIVLGVLGLIAGVVYFTVTADHLPSIMGHVAHSTHHRTVRGLTSLIGGAILVIVGAFLTYRARSAAD